MKETSMKRIVLASMLIVFSGMSTAQMRFRPSVLSVETQLGIPLTPEPHLFDLGGGLAVGGRYVYRSLAIGIEVHYQLTRLNNDDVGNLGFFSLVSAEAKIELRRPLWRQLDLYFYAGAGQYHVFQNGDPSQSVSNLVWSGGIGIGFPISTKMTIGIQSEYRRYCRFHHMLGVGLSVDLWLEGIN